MQCYYFSFANKINRDVQSITVVSTFTIMPCGIDGSNTPVSFML
ncbi:hypothetical protein [Colwellia sp.]|nr:hypothetical protein [Colwellia sp.]